MSDADDGKKPKKGRKGDREAKPKGRSNLVPAIIIAVGLVLGGKMMGGGGSAAATAPPSTHPADELDCERRDELKPPKEGAVVDLDPQVINLADGKYVKVGVALQLSTAENAETFEEEGLGAKAANQVIASLTGRSATELIERRGDVQEELTAAVRPLYECRVLEVLFKEFVVQ